PRRQRRRPRRRGLDSRLRGVGREAAVDAADESVLFEVLQGAGQLVARLRRVCQQLADGPPAADLEDEAELVRRQADALVQRRIVDDAELHVVAEDGALPRALT